MGERRAGNANEILSIARDHLENENESFEEDMSPGEFTCLSLYDVIPDHAVIYSQFPILPFKVQTDWRTFQYPGQGTIYH